METIEELITSKDGLTFAAKIKTPQGRTNHPIAKLIPLEVSTTIADQLSSVTKNDTQTVKDTQTAKNATDK